VSLWRNWRQTDGSRLAELRARPAVDGRPLPLAPGAPTGLTASFAAFPRPHGWATERVGLVLPTSLCSAQVAVLAAERLQARGIGSAAGISRFVALAHTEGCGFGGETMYGVLYRAYRGYATHPNVAAALLLEHGCEKIPNDAMRRQFEKANLPLDRFGWASVQLDGGIESWFSRRFAALPPATTAPADLGALTLGLVTAAPPAAAAAAALAAVTRAVVEAGGTVLLPESDPLLGDAGYRSAVLGDLAPHATLAYAQQPDHAGLHVVASETDHWVENLTGIGAAGAHLFLTVVSGHTRQGHPLVPVLQLAADAERGRLPGDDIDLFLSGDAEADAHAVVRLIAETAARSLVPKGTAEGFADFQLTRGLLGVST
jgi:altronate dehydratase